MTNEELEKQFDNYKKETDNKLEELDKIKSLLERHSHKGIETPKIKTRDLIRQNLYTFQKEYDNGDSGATATINWNNAQKQSITLTANCTFTFKNPGGPMGGTANFILKLVQDAGGTNTGTFPAEVLWEGGVAPTLSTGGGDVDIVSFYFDGTNYYGMIGLDFS